MDALRAAQETELNEEQQQRIKRLLANNHAAERRSMARSIEVMNRLNTAESKAWLKTKAAGPLSNPLAMMARNALEPPKPREDRKD
jgi:hypothetical protein